VAILVTCVAGLLAGGSVVCGPSAPVAVPTDWPSVSAASPSPKTVSVPENELNFMRAVQSAGTDEVEGCGDWIRVRWAQRRRAGQGVAR
jgi:hypothetical protein